MVRSIHETMAGKKTVIRKKEVVVNIFPVKGFVMMVMGIIFGGICVFGYMYIMDVHFRVPSPSVGKVFYLMVQMPPHWWMWIASGLFTSLILAYILGRLVLNHTAVKRAQETLHWRTREAFRYYKGKVEEVEGSLKRTVAERNSITEIASEFQAQLLAIDRIRASMPRNEIIQHRLMELQKKEPKVLKLPHDEDPVLTFTRDVNESEIQ